MIKISTEINDIEKRKTIEKINQTKHGFFEKIKKTEKKLSQNNQGERPKLKKYINEKGDITIYTKEIQRNIRGYYGNIYGKKLNNLEEIEKFLETYNLPQLENLNKVITSKEIESVINYLPTKTSIKNNIIFRN